MQVLVLVGLLIIKKKIFLLCRKRNELYTIIYTHRANIRYRRSWKRQTTKTQELRVYYFEPGASETTNTIYSTDGATFRSRRRETAGCRRRRRAATVAAVVHRMTQRAANDSSQTSNSTGTTRDSSDRVLFIIRLSGTVLVASRDQLSRSNVCAFVRVFVRLYILYTRLACIRVVFTSDFFRKKTKLFSIFFSSFDE